jgi:hypothetical protein
MKTRFLSARPSPAIVVAVMALVVALAGTAVAGPGAQSSAITKKKVKKVAKKQINKDKPYTSEDLAPSAVIADKLAQINTRTTTQTVPNTGFAGTTIVANCQGTEKLISGGVRAPGGDILMGDNHQQGQGWNSEVHNFGGAPVQVQVEAYCLSATSTPTP